jgi:hypothetical protein
MHGTPARVADPEDFCPDPDNAQYKFCTNFSNKKFLTQKWPFKLIHEPKVNIKYIYLYVLVIFFGTQKIKFFTGSGTESSPKHRNPDLDPNGSLSNLQKMIDTTLKILLNCPSYYQPFSCDLLILFLFFYRHSSKIQYLTRYCRYCWGLIWFICHFYAVYQRWHL